MSDLIKVSFDIPKDLLAKASAISAIYGSDFRTEIINLLKCYVDAYQQMHSDPVARALVGK